MTMESVNPTTGECMARHELWRAADLERALAQVAAATLAWQATAFEERARLLRNAATELRARNEDHARLITREMGKPIREARAEVEKCAWACEYYAEHAAAMLHDDIVATDATRSCVTYQPLGTLLAVMPWNFPYWQVLRAAAPALMAGNTVLLKHSSNVPQCALAIEEVFQRAGFPAGVFRALLISGAQAEALIADSRLHAVLPAARPPAGAWRRPPVRPSRNRCLSSADPIRSWCWPTPTWNWPRASA